MKKHFAFTTLLAAALAVAPKLSHAEDTDTRWESLRVYTLNSGNAVAVAVPSEWKEVDTGRALGAKTVLRYLDTAGTEVSIPVAALERASSAKRLFRPELTQKVACDER